MARIVTGTHLSVTLCVLRTVAVFLPRMRQGNKGAGGM
jgi:hypothetical protein